MPWVLIAAILGVAAFLALRGGGGPAPAGPTAGTGGKEVAGGVDGTALAEFNKGVALLEQYNYPEAYEAFLKVTRARPDWDAAHFNVGLAALNLLEKHFPEAEKELREALRLNPGNLHARFTMGILLRHQQKLDEAFEAFEADPDDPHAL
jgi:tetratricopeptide (TPR) repeat protein